MCETCGAKAGEGHSCRSAAGRSEDALSGGEALLEVEVEVVMVVAGLLE